MATLQSPIPSSLVRTGCPAWLAVTPANREVTDEVKTCQCSRLEYPLEHLLSHCLGQKLTLIASLITSNCSLHGLLRYHNMGDNVIPGNPGKTRPLGKLEGCARHSAWPTGILLAPGRFLRLEGVYKYLPPIAQDALNSPNDHPDWQRKVMEKPWRLCGTSLFLMIERIPISQVR